MKTALILGISGGFGGHVASVLSQQGYRLRTLMRDPTKLPAELKGVEVYQGDAGDITALRRAATGADILVYGVNSPYHLWHKLVVPMLEVTARVAEELGLLVLFPGNVYLYDPAEGPVFNEQAPLHPPRPKGVLRQQMEGRLRQATQNGARVIILRCGDFFGKRSPSSWLNVLVKREKNRLVLRNPARREIPHTWAYLPDVARVSAALLDRAESLEPFSSFHFPGYRITFREIAAAMEQASGRAVRLKPFPWWILRLAAPFAPFLRSLQEMRYLWQSELNLDGTKLEMVLGEPVTITPLVQAMHDSGVVGG